MNTSRARSVEAPPHSGGKAPRSLATESQRPTRGHAEYQAVLWGRRRVQRVPAVSCCAIRWHQHPSALPVVRVHRLVAWPAGIGRGLASRPDGAWPASRAVDYQSPADADDLASTGAGVACGEWGTPPGSRAAAFPAARDLLCADRLVDVWVLDGYRLGAPARGIAHPGADPGDLPDRVLAVWPGGCHHHAVPLVAES